MAPGSGDAPSIDVLVERVGNLQNDVTEIKRDMATRTDQAHVDDRIRELTGALEEERAERVAAVEAERRDRSRAIADEAGKREKGDQDEAAERKLVAARLQLVEDRQEARKYNTAIAIILAAIGALFGVVGALVSSGIVGGA
jgi:hypothetical protein